MRLQDVINEQAVLDVKFGGETLKLVYFPGKYTPEYEALVEKAGEEENRDRVTTMLAGLLKSWDLTTVDASGKDCPLATDEAALRTVPIRVLAAVLKAIVKDIAPNEKTSGSSANG